MKFWMVHGDGRGPTNHRHLSRESAVLEAKRLSALNEGVVFTVLESMNAYFVPDPVQCLSYDDPDDLELLRRQTALLDSPDDLPF